MGTSERETPRLYLVTPPLGDPAALADDLADALNAVSVAAVLLHLAAGEEDDLLARIAPLRILIQSNGAALLIDGHPALVRPAQADGAHVNGIDALKGATSLLKPQYIAGCGGLASRHDAMLAGETGADYVMFGEPSGLRPSFPAVLDRVTWWTEIFQVPCVGYAASLDEVAALARAGAEFVAVGEAIWRGSLRAAADRLAAVEPVR